MQRVCCIVQGVSVSCKEYVVSFKEWDVSCIVPSVRCFLSGVGSRMLGVDYGA